MKYVDGIEVPMTEEEEAAFEAQRAANRATVQAIKDAALLEENIARLKNELKEFEVERQIEVLEGRLTQSDFETEKLDKLKQLQSEIEKR